MKRKTMSTILLFVLGLPAAGIVGLSILSITATRPGNLGVTDGHLAPVPESPNCVSTQTDSADHRMPPMIFDPDRTDAMALLQKIVSTQPRVTIVQKDSTYLYAEFRSRLFRFVDDVEFLVDQAAGIVHFRSASRVGHSDMGVNRNRMELISREFADAASSQ